MCNPFRAHIAGCTVLALLAIPAAVTALERNDGFALEPDEDNLHSAVIDPAGDFAYFGTFREPGRVVKIDLGDFARVGALEMESGEDRLKSAVIDPVGQFAYFGTDTSPPTRVVKIDLASFERVEAAELGAGEDGLHSAVIDSTGTFAYFGTATFPGRVVKVGLEPFARVAAIELESGENNLFSAAIDPTGEFAYFGTNTFPGRVVKVDLKSFTRIAAIELESGENALHSAVIDPQGSYAYFGTGTFPGRVVKIDLESFTRVGAIELESGEDNLFSVVLEPGGHHAYFGTGTAPGRVVKIDLTTFARVGAVEMESGENGLNAAVLDPAGVFAYFGTQTFPGRVVKVATGAGGEPVQQETVLLSRADGLDGAKGNDRSFFASISADGRYVAFASHATNLHPDSTDDVRAVFVRDAGEQETILVSRASGADGAKGNAISFRPAISAGGRYVVFDSEASNLHPDAGDDLRDVYLRDLQTHETILVSRANGTGGAKGNANSFLPSVSADGRYVAFYSFATNLHPDDTDLRLDVFVRDLETHETILVSRASGADGVKGNFDSRNPRISADGRHVAFESRANSIHPDKSDSIPDVFVRDLETHETILVSRAAGADGAKGNGFSQVPTISADGRRVAFYSNATNLHPDDADSAEDVIVRDLKAHETILVSRADGADGEKGNDRSYDPSVSADGRHVAFYTRASNLHPDKTDSIFDVLVRDLEAHEIRLASRAGGAGGAKGNADSIEPSISADGRYVAFFSRATNLHPDDPDDDQDVYRRDLVGSPPGLPELAFDPSSLDFGEVKGGTTSDPLTATLDNTGDADATGLVFGTSGDGFKADTGDCGISLPAGSSCQVSVTFTPSEVGQAAATLEVSGDGEVAAELDLAGIGVEPAEPIAEITPEAFTFVLEQGSGETQTLHVGNLGTADLTWSLEEAEANPAALDPVVPRAAGRDAGEHEVKLTASDGEPDAFFGRAVAVQGDTAVIGAAGNVDGTITQGAAYVFTRIDGSWTEQMKLTASDGAAFSSFGNAVALDGDTVLIGAITTTVDGDVNRGAAYVFVRDGGTWSEQAMLVAPDGAGGDNFGSSVALEGDTALIGAHTANVDGNNNQGAAYVFTRSGDAWTERTKLTASDGALLDSFGTAVALQGDTILVGAGFANVAGTFNQGAVYMFGREDGEWLEQAKLTASDGAENLGFGQSLALTADTVVVGAPGDQVDGEFRGAAYVLVRSGETWLEQAKLTASDDGTDGGEFGSSVALVGDLALAGAPWTVVDGNAVQGAAWLFLRDGATWSREAKLVASDGASDDFLGGAVALADGNAFAGAWLADVDGNSSQGAVYVFSLDVEGPPEGCADPVDIPWLSADPIAGTTPPGDGVPVAVTVDATGLESGEHTAQLCVATNDPNAPMVAIPVTLTVKEAGVPELAFEPASLDFGEVEVGTSESLVATLRNTGTAEATGLAFGGLPDVGFEAETGACGPALPAGGSCAIDVTFTPVEPGPVAATLEVIGDEEAAATVALSGHGLVDGTAFAPAALEVDLEPLVSDGNDVFEPGEAVVVAPAWRNDGTSPHLLDGEAAGFTGPAGASYTIDFDVAHYGLVAPGASASCRETGICYELRVDDPVERPATLWVAALDEELSDGTTHTWSLHVGDSFTDVPRSSPFYRSIETLLHHEVTGGCSETEYCPTALNTRAQIPVFVLRALEGPGYEPQACVPDEEMFADVPATSGFCPWIEELARRDVVTGCGGDNYCPNVPINRAQMAVVLLRTLEGPDYTPPACRRLFVDLPCSSPFAPWVEALYERDVIAGCGTNPLRYCPTMPVNRQQMAVFVTETFGLTLYGP